ncbi:hypothetical protein [Actinomadura atramentaria]|uniref:hypothetical protein n=1 Tax=Actinomadura atramentaria TaxID=1990 RepID=UPI00037B4605|nr:hypothetical protein [Actinomadura atramentaria]
MHEYQYYEFMALDRPLDDRQRAEIRALSTGARMTPIRFIDEYVTSDFHGDPRTMMERYYDAHLYVTNWGTHRLMFRLPRGFPGADVVHRYLAAPYVVFWTHGPHLILDLTSEDEDGDWVEDTEGVLAGVAGVRAELIVGDLRPLYLAWLAAYGRWEEDDDIFDDGDMDRVEPPVPAGLDALTPCQLALGGLMRLDPALLAVAAEGSPARYDLPDDPDALADWIGALPPHAKDRYLLRIAEGGAIDVRADLLRRFHDAIEVGTHPVGRPRRTVGELLAAARALRAEHGYADLGAELPPL